MSENLTKKERKELAKALKKNQLKKDKAGGLVFGIVLTIVTKIAVAGWGRLLKLDALDSAKIDKFIDLYKNGPGVPEPLAGCGTAATQ